MALTGSPALIGGGRGGCRRNAAGGGGTRFGCGRLFTWRPEGRQKTVKCEYSFSFFDKAGIVVTEVRSYIHADVTVLNVKNIRSIRNSFFLFQKLLFLECALHKPMISV